MLIVHKRFGSICHFHAFVNTEAYAVLTSIISAYGQLLVGIVLLLDSCLHYAQRKQSSLTKGTENVTRESVFSGPSLLFFLQLTERTGPCLFIQVQGTTQNHSHWAKFNWYCRREHNCQKRHEPYQTTPIVPGALEASTANRTFREYYSTCCVDAKWFKISRRYPTSHVLGTVIQSSSLLLSPHIRTQVQINIRI